jgi:hypothetical protein
MHRASLALHILLAIALTAFTIEQIFAPASWWIEIHKIFVPDATVGDKSPLIAIDDTIHRSFIGRFYFEIRKVGNTVSHGDPEDLTRFTYFCSGDGEISFRPGSDPFANASLDWLTRNKCPPFAVGSYYAQAILVWGDFLAARSIEVQSNVWTVSPPDEPPPAAKVIIQKPVVNQVTRTVTRTIVQRARCEPSIIPPRSCPPPRSGRRRVR